MQDLRQAIRRERPPRYQSTVSGEQTTMPFPKKLPIIILLSMACLFFGAGVASAEQRYIVDTLVVSLREGPGPHFKAIKTLQTGQSFEVLETQEDFVRVRTAEGDEGWVQSQYTDPRPPKAVVVKELNEKITALTAENEQLLAKSERLAAQLSGQGLPPTNEQPAASATDEAAKVRQLEEELADLSKRYTQLEADAKDVLPVTKERDRLHQELAAARESVAKLQQANASLTTRQNIYWFLAGSGVFMLGWMVGRGSSSRRQRPSLTL